MAKLLKLRRGTNTQHSSFTGAEGEVTVNTTNDSLHVHDGSTAGGRELMRADKNNMPTSGVTAGTYGSSSAIPAITVDAKGLVTSASTNAIDSTSIANGTSNVSVASSGNITATRSGTTRLTVNNSGIDVTGSVTCDELTCDGVGRFNTSSEWQAIFKDSNNSGSAAEVGISFKDSADTTLSAIGPVDSGNNNFYITNSQAASIVFQTGNTNRVQVDESGHFKPNTDDTYDLGTSSLQWRNGFFDGTVNCDALSCEGTGTFTGNITTNGQLTVGNGANNSYINMHDSDNGTRNIHCNSNYIGFLMQNGSWGARCDDNGHWHPGNDNTHDLGSSSLRWRNVYTMDMNLSNEGSTNDIDGTWGSWTIQEGEDDLFLLNRRNGKKYKFNLSEVN